LDLLSYLIAAAIAYLLGSIPVGLLVARLRGNVDLLRQGSGKTGTTNVLRTLGWKAAGAVFAGDFLKGVLAVIASGLVSQHDHVANLIAGLAVIAGHNYSLYLKFRGGRGVVAGLGALAVMAPVVMLLVLALAFTIIGLTRYVSLGSLTGAAATPIIMAVLVATGNQSIPHLLYSVIAALIVAASHRDNISRLLKGTERRLGERIRTERRGGCAELATSPLPTLLADGAQQIRHLDSAHPGVEAFVAGLGARSLDRLLDVVGCDHPEDHRHARLKRHVGDALGYLRGHVVEVRRCAPDDRSQADHRGVAPGLGKCLRCQGNLEGTGHPGHIQVTLLDTVTHQRVPGPVQQLAADELVEPGHDCREAESVAEQLALKYPSHQVSPP
jgi:acyl phosphate:glycerol-3-phosphate acyltransferase